VPRDTAGGAPARAAILPLEIDGVILEAGGRRLLHRVDLTLTAGPPTVILGANGAGKSLLLRLCHGLIAPSAGTVAWRGPDRDRAARHQAMVFQRPVLLRRSVRANLTYPLAVRGVPRAERRERVAAALTRAGLDDLADRPARLLSGGQQQRLALARAWALEPQVLFLDEPTASLDPTATKAVEGLVRAIAGDGTKIVMTTHDLGQARRLARRIVFLDRGRVVEDADADAFFDRPATEAARAFLDGRLV